MPESTAPIAWIDVETSGLTPEGNDLLEIAAMVTTGPDYSCADAGLALTVHPQRFVHLDPTDATAALRSQMPEPVTEMHTESGLLEDIAKGRSVPLGEADELVHAYLEKHFGPREAILGGNSISLDRSFLEVYAPKTYAHLHYRSLDCTSVYELVRRLPSVDEGTPLQAEPQGVTHRAMADVLTSIAQARLLSGVLRGGLSLV